MTDTIINDNEKVVDDAFQHLMDTYLASPHRKKVDIITKAFNFARQAHKGVKRLSEETGIPLLAQIPVVQGICEKGDNGEPIVLDYNSMVGQSFLSLAQSVVTQTNRRNAEQPKTQRVEVNK